MVGDDHDAVLRPEQGGRHFLAVHRQVRVMPHPGQFGNVRVVVADPRPFPDQQFHDLEAGRLARVVHVFLVGHAQEQELAALDGLAPVVAGVGDPLDDVRGQGAIDLAGQLEEPGGQWPLAASQFPRINWDR